ncbi:MAG TPA: hypothetical protein VFV72_03950 [Candidatus Limnocylindrales bacterium]|nr:hypothetical protein [Candidatus Limnocylindrales bacterium]
MKNVVAGGDCRVTMTYEVDLTAQTYGCTSPTDTVPGYDVWAGSTWQPAATVSGSANVTFQLARAAG